MQIKYVRPEVNEVLRSKLNNMLPSETLVCKVEDGFINMKAKLRNGCNDIMVELEMINEKSTGIILGIVSTQLALDIYGESVALAGNDIAVKKS